MKGKSNKLIITVFLGILVLLGIGSARQKSATYDELPHLGHGYFYLKTGKLRTATPVANILAALPLFFLDVRCPIMSSDVSLPETEFEKWGYYFGDRLIYSSNYDADRILLLGRFIILLLSCLGAFFLFKWAKEMYGPKSGILALFLYTFSPNILAHSRLVTHDLAVTVFVLIALYWFWNLKNSPTVGNLVLAGLSLGLALSSKHTAIILLPSYLFLWVSFFLFSKGEFPPKGITLKKGCLSLLVLLFIALLIVFLFHGLSLACVKKYLMGFFGLASQAQGRSSFLMGENGMGWYHYFLVAFLIKTPIPTLILLILSLIFFKKVRKNLGDELILIIPIVILFTVASYSRFNIGLRHILPIYPLLFILVSKTANLKFKGSWALILILCGWYLFSSLRIYPHYLAYFNELVGGPENGYKYLVDSNLDWGQDLKRLKTYMDKERIKEIYLAYFGVANREYHGIKYQYLPGTGFGLRQKHILSSSSRELLAVSASVLWNLCGHSPIKKPYAWLHQGYKPIAKIGYSIFIYDLTGDLNAHRNLAGIYLKAKHPFSLDFCIHEYERIVALNPENAMDRQELNRLYTLKEIYRKDPLQMAIDLPPKIYPTYRYKILGLIYQDIGKRDEAIRCFEKVLRLNPEDKLAQRMMENLSLTLPSLSTESWGNDEE
ncbi:glycosyltransferase family 39 protein [bacterium]|nr:glycosyltransferase family 39 protein [bacterium]